MVKMICKIDKKYEKYYFNKIGARIDVRRDKSSSLWTSIVRNIMVPKAEGSLGRVGI